MSYKSLTGTLYSMNDREYEALQRATAKLRAKQHKHWSKQAKPEPPKPSGIKGVYWNGNQAKWDVYIWIKGEKHWCGSTKNLNEAPDMQWKAEKEITAKSKIDKS